MKYNNIIKKQLMDYIKQPTVLMTKDGAPYEYKKGGSINRLKRRRINDENIPLELYSFILANNISKTQLQEFASGLILNYAEIKNIYI